MGLMKTLDQIGIENGTDKASVFTRTYAKPHDYLRHMEKFFEPLRDQPIKFLEIGVGGGESIRTWIEYFSKAQIYGVDFVQNTNEWNTPGRMTTRYAFSHGDQTDAVMWKCFVANWGGDWGVIVDDGSHDPMAVQNTFSALWPLVKPGGYYCVEDMGCGFTNPGFPSHPEWCAALGVQMVATGITDIDSIYIARELCIIRKSCTPS